MTRSEPEKSNDSAMPLLSTKVTFGEVHLGCPEWEHLMDRWRIAEKVCNDAVKTASNLDAAAFEEACVRAQAAKNALRKTEQALQRHVQQHGCFRRGSR
jgi:hypothetical protein